MDPSSPLALRSSLFLLAGAGCALNACRDVDRFSSGPNDHYEGTVVQGSFVRAGVDESTALCLRLDADHLQDAPGTLSTSDGLFRDASLRPIPQLFHDPLSTFSFGEGRIRNLLYAVAPVEAGDGGSSEGDVTAVLSLLQSGNVEVRLLRGAPPLVASSASAGALADAAPSSNAASGGTAEPIFAVFPLSRRAGSCSF